MKFFNLCYALSESDYNLYDRLMFKENMKIRIKRIAVIYIIALVAFAIFDLYFAVMALLFLTLSLIIPMIISKEFALKTRHNSRTIERPLSVDFYDDHIEISTYADSNYRSSSIRHCGFDKIHAIFESSQALYFTFSDNSVLIIPKNVLNNENNSMIRNLIENLFKNKYQTLG